MNIQVHSTKNNTKTFKGSLISYNHKTLDAKARQGINGILSCTPNIKIGKVDDVEGLAVSNSTAQIVTKLLQKFGIEFKVQNVEDYEIKGTNILTLLKKHLSPAKSK